MACGSGSIYCAWDTGAEVRACSCNCWSCDTCNPRRRAWLRDEALSGAPTTFITLTWDANRAENPAQARRIMARALDHLRHRIRREFPGHEFEYLCVVEAFKNGYPHFHLLARAPFIPWCWLSNVWRDLTGAWVVRIEWIRDREAAAGYVAKYLSKEPVQFGHGKRYWFTQGYRPPADPDAAKERRRRAWRWVPERPEIVVHHLQRQAHQTGKAWPEIWCGPDRCILREVERARAPP